MPKSNPTKGGQKKKILTHFMVECLRKPVFGKWVANPTTRTLCTAGNPSASGIRGTSPFLAAATNLHAC